MSYTTSCLCGLHAIQSDTRTALTVTMRHDTLTMWHTDTGYVAHGASGSHLFQNMWQAMSFLEHNAHRVVDISLSKSTEFIRLWNGGV